MGIIRADIDDTCFFTREKLRHGACCFYTEDRACRYYFEISGQEAILFADENRNIDEAIDTFLFYSGFIALVKDPRGTVLRERAAAKLIPTDIRAIQPSQFFINEDKLAHCKSWIRGQSDIMIPTGTIRGKIVSLDGHTRLRAALELGYDFVYTYADDFDDDILPFVDEAIRRRITSVSDMQIVSNEEYKIKWHQYCDQVLQHESLTET